MVGSKDMNLHGWRQLIEWSMEHASLDKEERRLLQDDMWQPMWNEFIRWVNESFADVQRIGSVKPREAKQRKDESVQEWTAREQVEDLLFASEKLQFDQEKAQWRDRIGKLRVGSVGTDIAQQTGGAELYPELN